MVKQKRIFKTTFDRYYELKVIGNGGAGQVLKVRNQNEEEYALKLLHPNRVTREKLARFKNELNFGLRNNHKNIISVIDHGNFAGSDGDSPFYIMKCYQKSLRQLLNDSKYEFNFNQVLSDLLDAVEAAHKMGIVHRDIKPENILFDSENKRLLLADFGIAQFNEELLIEAIKTKNTTRLANFRYSAPEQRDPKLHDYVGAKSDIFSLGLIINELFTKEVPQGSGYQKVGDINPEYIFLDEIIDKMIKQNVDERYESIEEIKIDLIGLKQEFIQKQKLIEEKAMVIKETTIYDPLINDPPRLIGANWNNGNLFLTLSQEVSRDWVDAMRNMGDYGSVANKGPERFYVNKNIASIPSDESTNQRVIDFFKSWLPKINSIYKQKIERENEKRIMEEKKRAEEAIRSRERHIKINSNLKI